MRLTVVGGGSTYTPELVDGIAGRRASLDVDEIVLVDPDTHRLRIVGDFCQRLLEHAGHPAKVLTTSSLEQGAEGASAVLLQLRVGGQKARRSDETFPHACGCIGQETTGAGGLAKALRTVPVVLDIAERVRRVAGDDTWIVNFTNPVGIVTRALLQAGHRAVGLCNVAIHLQRQFAALFGVDTGAVRLDHIGLNHLTWERGVHVTTADGTVDRLPDLLGEFGEHLAAEIGSQADWMRRMNAVPSYYLKYYYAHDDVLADQLENPPRADVVIEVENELLKLYADPAVVTKPESLAKRGGAYYSEAAVQLVHALTGGGAAEEHVVNVRNNGAMPFLPDDAVIEVPATVDGSGAVPLPIKPVEPRFSGLISHVTAYEYLALEAALHGGRDRVADALLAHPLIGQYKFADRLADELIAANRADLPWANA
ncbi:6-phospho-beta-glucosidase [Kibdelosporangium phytohabitans]|uniref:6-phospho-beta-glucosidase n=1 Tax=Kibdelosporangium phytohabitans TaxID=860235 RepID=A0A0N9I2I1_9PSEU|nr:6-phospho-beta-glucosidase [Kibdelosporangium phytohabitans]ALG08933.1 6-phospho-beta-glucosidase [Kibdelosporangium phytohabitans]MBE1469906.1 6-phospho-beta-glucosidase [Kibdelosporangium phytohabitans]